LTFFLTLRCRDSVARAYVRPKLRRLHTGAWSWLPGEFALRTKANPFVTRPLRAQKTPTNATEQKNDRVFALGRGNIRIIMPDRTTLVLLIIAAMVTIVLIGTFVLAGMGVFSGDVTLSFLQDVLTTFLGALAGGTAALKLSTTTTTLK
jgi:hypothetical protein